MKRLSEERFEYIPMSQQSITKHGRY